MQYANYYGDRAKSFINRAGKNFSVQDEELWELMTEMPKLNLPMAGVAALINFVLPGLGTIMAGCLEP